MIERVSWRSLSRSWLRATGLEARFGETDFHRREARTRQNQRNIDEEDTLPCGRVLDGIVAPRGGVLHSRVLRRNGTVTTVDGMLELISGKSPQKRPV